MTERTDVTALPAGSSPPGSIHRSWTTTLRRLATVVAAAVALIVVSAGPASAHARLLLSDPADGAVLPAVPDQLKLQFSEQLAAGFVTVTVTGSDGQQRPLPASDLTGDTVVQPLPALGSGQYTVGYRVVSQDGHPIQGRITLTFESGSQDPQASATTDPAVPATTVPTAAQEPASVSAWPFLIGALVVTAIGVVTVLRRSRR